MLERLLRSSSFKTVARIVSVEINTAAKMKAALISPPQDEKTLWSLAVSLPDQNSNCIL